MTRMKMLGVAVALLCMTGTALGQKKKSDDCGEQRKNSKTGECTLVIDGDDLTGDIVKPGGDRLLARKIIDNWSSLIRIRVTYVDKLVKSTDDL